MSEQPETVFEGKWLRMIKRGRWEYAERTNKDGMAVIIVAVTPESKLVFVEQFRVPVDCRTIEMPACSVTPTRANRSNWPPNANCWRKPAGRQHAPKY
jgi:hypothetical protein